MNTALCVGNVMLDIFLRVDAYRTDEHTGDVCLRPGDKVLAQDAVMDIGGCAANVAVGLTRLGIKSSVIAETGDDVLSTHIVSTLSQKDVDTRHILRTKGASATFAVGLNFGEDRTIFPHHIIRQHAMSFPADRFDWMYITSVGEHWQDMYHRAYLYAREHAIPVACNPGSPQLKAGADTLKEILSIAQILFVNKEELAHLSGVSDMRDGISRMHERGVAHVVVTDGKNGAWMSNAETVVHQDIVPGVLVEKTGAGDAFASGYLSALMHGEDHVRALTWGAHNSASVIGHRGAQQGLLTLQEMKERVT